jgi:hypothetical protein
MPAPAAEVLYCYGESKELSETAHKILRKEGFHPSETDGSVIEMDDYIAYHFQPFEDREANIELLETCVSRLSAEFPELEVWLQSRPNKDYGNPIAHGYSLYIAPSQEAVSDSRQSDANADQRTQRADDGDGSDKKDEETAIDWRAEFRERE